MLRGTVAFLILVVFAVVGSDLRVWLARRGLRAPTMEGLSFLAVGVILGEQGLGLFPEDVLSALRLVVLLGLAWIGLMFGLQLDWRIMRQLRPWHRAVGWLVPLLIGVVLALGGRALGLAAPVCIGLAGVGMAASPSTLEVVARGRRPADRSALRLIKLVMATSGMPAVLALALASSLDSPLAAAGVPWWQLLAFMAGLGIVVGYLSLVLVRGVTDRIGMLTMLTGTMTGLAGVSALLGWAGLPAAVAAGAVLVNRSAFHHRLLRVAHALERPMLVVLLVLVGASWQGVHVSWPVFALLAVGRPAAALAAGALLAGIAVRRGVAPAVPAVGLGLLPQGELALGLAVAMVGFVGGSEGVLEAVVAAIALHQLIGQLWIRRVLFLPSDRGPS
jgi:hypothetical protein